MHQNNNYSFIKVDIILKFMVVIFCHSNNYEKCFALVADFVTGSIQYQYVLLQGGTYCITTIKSTRR